VSTKELVASDPRTLCDAPPAWLPELVICANIADWGAYEAELHDYYHRDFVRGGLVLDGRRVSLKRYPEMDGLPATFWHIISSGEERVPDLRRCERIRWPAEIIRRASDASCVCRWDERNHPRGHRVCLALPDFSYLVVLDDRESYVLMWTAFCVEQPHRRAKLARRCASCAIK
jgi:hypothetical protein